MLNEFIRKSITKNSVLIIEFCFFFYWREKPKPSIVKTDQISQTEHQVDRVVYIDEPPPKQPSVATKAFVRNLGSSSVQQHMSWDSDSVSTQRTNSDLFVDWLIFLILLFWIIKSRDSHRKYRNNIIHPTSSKKTGTHSPHSTEQQQRNVNNERTNQV